jgi:hypothetical protein
MDFQTIIVALIILGAIAFAGNSLRHKVSAFKPKGNSCGSNCGCEGNAKNK